MQLPRLLQIAWTEWRTYFLRKDAADSTPYKLTANGFDASSAEVTNVGAATADTSAPNLAQVKQLVSDGDYRGMIHGYVKVVSSSPTFHLDNGSGVTVGSTTATANKLYLVLENMTIASVAYIANDVIWYNGSTFVCNNTLATFDASSTAADVGGSLARCSYNIKINGLAGHELYGYPSGMGTFSDGTYIKWNAEYDSSADNNMGRWNFLGSEGNVPVATKSVMGKSQLGDGIAVASGVISADFDTARGISWSGASSPTKQFGMNVSASIFEFIAGVLSIKSGIFASASHTHAAADLPVRGLTTDTFTGISLAAAGSSVTLTLSAPPVIPRDAGNSYKSIMIFINGIKISYPNSTAAPIVSSTTLTLKRDSLLYNIAPTDEVDVVYVPGV